MTPELKHYCSRWSADMDRIGGGQEGISYFRRSLPELLLDKACVGGIFEAMVKGGSWPDLRAAGLFDHEVLLYLDPGRRFSLRLFFHPAGEHTAIHDHSSWGVSGTPFGHLSVIGYAPAKKTNPGETRLTVIRRTVLSHGKTDLTLPFDDGIHQTGSPGDEPNAMISVYGPPGRRRYIRIFDPYSGRVEKRFPPKILRRSMARQALSLLQNGWIKGEN
ncbi:MAG: hypothetical protein P8X55_17065 [Desulfosarcinaceae bacterium]